MTDYHFSDVVEYVKGSTRPAGKCLGLANNDIVGHFGKLGNTPWSATAAADELAHAGQLYTSACPDYPHVDFYYFTEEGIEYGHVDWHFPQHGVHIADSGRITVKLNAKGTVGTYPSWGPRRGWAKVPALNAQVSFVNDAGAPTPPPAPSGGGASGKGWAVNLPSADVQERIQQGLKNRGRYKGVVDGAFGTLSWKGIQTTLQNVGYTGVVDGIPGQQTCHFIQVYAQRFGGYKGPIDNILGPNSWLGFAKGINP